MPNNQYPANGRPNPNNLDKTQLRQAPPKTKRKPELNDDNIDYDYERSVKFANRGCLIAFVAAFLAVALVLLIGFLFIQGELNGNNGSATGTLTIEIPRGSTRSDIGEILKENGLIGNESIFRFYTRINGISGFQSGKYQLEGGMSYEDILNVLIVPDEERGTIRLTFPPGSTVWQFAQICEDNDLCTAEEFIEAANAVENYSDIEFFKYVTYEPGTYMKAEGYLAPNTYDFFLDEDPEDIVRKLYVQFNKDLKAFSYVSNGVDANIYDRLEELDMSLREVITMASIVEKEASISVKDQASVAGVFYNRMSEDRNTAEIPRATLGSDVTLRYLADFVARDYDVADMTGWTLADIKTELLRVMPESVFYAYFTGDDDEKTHEGLPAGPICNPNITAITAALWPEQHGNYYFLTDYYGKFYYARTYREHQNNIAIMYQENEKWEQEQAASSQSSAA